MTIAKNFHLHQLNVNNVFLHEDLDEEVYMTPPPCYPQKEDRKVCKLSKPLHGLHQASRQWFSKLSIAIFYIRFWQAQPDHSLFVKSFHSSFIALLVHVDDIILGSNDINLISELKDFWTTSLR